MALTVTRVVTDALPTVAVTSTTDVFSIRVLYVFALFVMRTNVDVPEVDPVVKLVSPLTREKLKVAATFVVNDTVAVAVPVPKPSASIDAVEGEGVTANLFQTFVPPTQTVLIAVEPILISVIFVPPTLIVKGYVLK